MNKEQAITLVDNILANSFDSGRFQTLIVELFNYGDHFRPKQTVPERFRELVAEVRLLNEDDSDLLILEVQLATGVSVERNRSLQRNLIAHYLNNMNKDAALVGFHVDDAPDQWRFSFVRRDLQLDTTGAKTTVKTDFSPVRRFSYLVGKGEQTHTAQKQLLDLLTRDDKKSIEIEDLQAAFDVEPVSKAFFNQYRSLFDDTHEALKSFLASHPDHKAHFDSHQIEPAEFAKRILAQIVFLYFLQRKGWLGVASGKGWGSGDRQFLRTMFEQREAGDSYYRSFLQPLFYEVLAYKRERDVYDRWNVRIPFLNGGLFEPWRGYKWQEQSIDLPDSLFSNADDTGILDIFDRYNFTVQEDDPVEREVAVDPEILGKVFENLIEENRRHASGTYYTPRSVVHYMCQEVLIDHLADRHPRIKRADVAILIREGRHRAEQLQWASEEGAAESRQLGLPRAIVNAAAALDASLKSVTICDPAVGSGAFPLGMLNEIIHARMALDAHLGRGLTEFNAKLHAINHSLYGVDLDGGAVEIAKLRLWLSLVVDEENSAQIQPLPNLDYKMMQGNSLISHLDGMSLIDDSLLTRQLETPRTADGLRRQLVPLQRQALEIQQSPDAVTTETRKKLKELQADIRRLENRITRAEATPKRGDDEFDLLTEFDEVANTRRAFLDLQQQFFKCTDTDEKRRLREQIDNTHDQLVIFSIEQDGSLSADEKAAALDAFNAVKGQYEKPYFLWQLDFNPVFASDEGDADVGTADAGGFDIVIGNPPYVRHEEIGDDGKQALEIEWGAQFQGTADLYTYFYFRGLDILRPGGHLTYITSNKFMRARYGERLREELTEQSHIREIIDCGDTGVFEAIAYPAIYRLQKGTPDKDSTIRIGEITNVNQLADIPAHMVAQAFDQPQASIGGDSWLLEPAEIRNLIAKLHASGQTLGDYLGDRIYRGVLTGFNDAFVIDTPTRDALVAADPKSAEIIKPWLRGRDIKRWKAEWAGLWVIAIASSSNRSWPWSDAKTLEQAETIFANTYPAIYKHLLPYRDRARKRHDKGVYWWELRSCSYYEAFERPKIVYPNIAKRNEFALETKGFLTNQKAFLIDSDDEALLAYLNSSVVDFWFRHRLPKLQNGFLEPSKVFLEKLPLPDDLEPLRQGDLHMPLGTVASPDANLDDLRLDAPDQFTIDFITWRMFDLDPSEIEIIERATGLRDDEVEVEDIEDISGDGEPVVGYLVEQRIEFPNAILGDEFSDVANQFTDLFCENLESAGLNVAEQVAIAEEEEVMHQWRTTHIKIHYTEGSLSIIINKIVKVLIEAGVQITDFGAEATTAAIAIMRELANQLRKETTDATTKSASQLSQNNPNIDFGSNNVFHGSVTVKVFTSNNDLAEREAQLKAPEEDQNQKLPNSRSETHLVEYDEEGNSDKKVHKSGPQDDGEEE